MRFSFLRRLSLAVLAFVPARAALSQVPQPLTAQSDNPALSPKWQAATREIYKRAVESRTVAGAGQVPALASYLAAKLKAAGWAPGDVRVVPYVSGSSDKSAALIARWRGSGGAATRPSVILAHLDVVPALKSDWSTDPFTLIEKDGYFYGRGTSDDKQGAVAAMVALEKLRAEGFRPVRDVILLFTGDEETNGRGAELAATEWRKWIGTPEMALNADEGDCNFAPDGRPLGCRIQTAEKTYQSYTFTVRNPGGHSSKPRPDNAIYDLADALKRLQSYRFTPVFNATTHAYFEARAAQEGDSPLGRAMRAWLANPADGAAADAIEADPDEVGYSRTRCVATMLKAGQADNALPQLAQAVVNCRIMPGVAPAVIRDELQSIAGGKVEVALYGDPGSPTPASPLRPDVVNAFTRSVHRLYPGQPVIPYMSTGATDSVPFRAAGVPAYGVNGKWWISPTDEREHGKDERLPVNALWNNVVHWESLIRDLAG
jgi:acetylornithine deacetylase/succinyl-diaminopimelate desuccinylase-like protein